MMITTRQATDNDADQMSEILSPILISWKSDRPSDADHILRYYIEHPDSIKCTIAEDETGKALGFQSLIIATDNKPYDVPNGWGIIGTYVRLDAARCGVGKHLFASSLEAAKQAGLKKIDATIGQSNETGLAYYEAMGFRTYKTSDTSVSKVYEMEQA